MRLPPAPAARGRLFWGDSVFLWDRPRFVLPGQASSKPPLAPASPKRRCTKPRPDGLQQNGRACAKNTSPAVVIVNLGSFAPAGATRACAALDLRPGSPGGHNLWDRPLRLPEGSRHILGPPAPTPTKKNSSRKPASAVPIPLYATAPRPPPELPPRGASVRPTPPKSDGCWTCER